MKKTEIMLLADKVRAVALEGLKYAKDPYDIARYETLLDYSVQEFSNVLDLNFDRLKEDFKKELGCVTPKLGVDGLVYNAQKEILIVERVDGTGWCLPCGWVDIGETPFEAIIREIKEETSLTVRALECISISTKGPTKTQNIQHQVNMLIATEVIGGSNIKLSHEHLNYKWILSTDNIEWHSNHQEQAEKALAWIKK